MSAEILLYIDTAILIMLAIYLYLREKWLSLKLDSLLRYSARVEDKLITIDKKLSQR